MSLLLRVGRMSLKALLIILLREEFPRSLHGNMVAMMWWWKDRGTIGDLGEGYRDLVKIILSLWSYRLAYTITGLLLMVNGDIVQISPILPMRWAKFVIY